MIVYISQEKIVLTYVELLKTKAKHFTLKENCSLHCNDYFILNY